MNQQGNTLQIQQGNILQGFPVSPIKYQGVTTLAQIEAFGLIRPTLIDRYRTNFSAQQKAAYELHAVTNRTFSKARLDNAKDYEGYIEAVDHEKNRAGGTPAITLYHRDELKMTEDGALIPYGAGIVAIDGETQTEARYRLGERIPSTKNIPFAVTVYHGIDVNTAMQILHDYNTKGLAWNESKAARFNREGKLSKAAEDIINRSQITPEKVNYRGDRGTLKHSISLKQLLTGIVGYQLNGAGIESAVTASHFKRFNDANAVAVPDDCVNKFVLVVNQAATDEHIKNAPPQLWQVAGVLISKQIHPSHLDWQNATQTYEDTKSSGRGGPRIFVKQRLSLIKAAMFSE